MGMAPLREAGPKARAAALKAVELDDTLAGVHGVLGDVTVAFTESGGKKIAIEVRILLPRTEKANRIERRFSCIPQDDRRGLRGAIPGFP
jgi:hypothetical protein